MREDGTDPSSWLAEERPNVLGAVQLRDSMQFFSLQTVLHGVPFCPARSPSDSCPRMLCWPSPGA